MNERPREGNVAEAARISTGSRGLNDVLGGGLDPQRMYLYEGRPGSGKTTLALQFLREGVRQGERALYITLSETESELRLVAKRHGSPSRGSKSSSSFPPRRPWIQAGAHHPASGANG